MKAVIQLKKESKGRMSIKYSKLYFEMQDFFS